MRQRSAFEPRDGWIGSMSVASRTRSRPLPRDGNSAAGRRPPGGMVQEPSASASGVSSLLAMGRVVSQDTTIGSRSGNRADRACRRGEPVRVRLRSWKNAVSKPTGGLCCRDGHSAILRPPRVRVRPPACGVPSRTVQQPTGAGGSETETMSETVQTAHEPDESSNEAEMGPIGNIVVFAMISGAGITAAAFSAAGTPQNMTGVGVGMVLFGLSFFALGKSAGWDDE